ncbi:zinc/cadmium resistance protein [Penicillium atrosanguineum]|uniref:Major facilitator superfamily domain general substrate transporter n=1 Tax=Penicillium atrosanguineum TaxID=1132637 RepID=UPI002386919E|nr:Major facilitator superfamily domain general substrate transporter [Penicillium atrosanguineum]KAJ5140903.1 zinc/cadmium resistance protein [Penicillium atrosanguineum]KAJ5310814.1 Major facilitator superfamily domain general substrate transporter [Penicillium atrosanguineum]
MGLSKTNRIIILLVIDTAFFLLELITGMDYLTPFEAASSFADLNFPTGYAVHSLALVADSFHMLNDVISLCVGLWAVKVANQETNSKMYTYGWQRAETLGALVNGVFLVALCMSIFLEAIQRLVEPQEVQNPKLVCIVGCLGLLSNMVGLALFHDHSHGGHGHGHDHGHSHDEHDDVEQGYSDHVSDEAVGDERGSVASIMPENQVGVVHSPVLPKNSLPHPATEPASPVSRKRLLADSTRGTRRFSTSTGRPLNNVEDIYAHPATMRQDIIAAGRGNFDDPSSDSDSRDDEGPTEQSGLLRHRDRASNYTDEHDAPFKVHNHDEDIHKSHNHAQPKPKGKGGHGHDLNMRGVFLHVMGDALGNIGVIVSALIIWLTDYEWRFYVDPGISLVITIIILASAIPLCKAASRILLQAVPPGMSIDHIKEDIEGLPGILGSHHLHVWQLSDTKIVASIHIQVDTEIKGEGSERYMNLARQVRRCLHAYGIHSSTIQPEFAPDADAEETQNQIQGSSSSAEPNPPSRAASLRSDPQACLLECDDHCARGGQCCPKKST